MRDLSSAIEALAKEWGEADDAYHNPTMQQHEAARRLRAILAECEEPDLENASLPRMPTSKRTVTLHEEPAETAKERVIRVINQSDEEWFAGDPSGGGSNLPAPKRWRCTVCGESVVDLVVMPDGTRRHKCHDGFWCGPVVEEMK